MKNFFEKIKLPGSVFIIIASLLWSLDGILRGGLRDIPAASLVTFEHLLGLVILSPILVRSYKEFTQASRSAQISLVITSLISGALGTIFYTAAIGLVFANGIPFANVVLLQQLQPIFVIILARVILKEKLNTEFLITTGFALFGAYLINFPTLLPDLSSPNSAVQISVAILALLAAFSWGAGTIFSKAALAEIPYKTATAFRFLFTVGFGLLILAAWPAQRFPITELTPEQILGLIVIVFSAGAVALLFYYKGLSQTKAKYSSILELTWPASAFLIDLARGVQYTPTQLAGAIILAVMIVRISRMSAEKDQD
jgi:drug/metabolite transporter (DMT)-like permease